MHMCMCTHTPKIRPLSKATCRPCACIPHTPSTKLTCTAPKFACTDRSEHLIPDECGSEVFGPPVWSEILRTCQTNNISRPIIIGPIFIHDSRRMTACSSHLSVGRRVVQCLVHVQVLTAREGSARQRRRFKDTPTQICSMFRMLSSCMQCVRGAHSPFLRF